MHYDFIIVGGGAGGLELAARLGREFGKKKGPEKVLLIDRAAYHIWKPTLHEVAVGTLNPQQEGLSYSMLARRNHFSYMLGTLTGLDPKEHKIELSEVHGSDGELIIPKRIVTFNECILAIGSGSNFYNTPGSKYAYILENANDALKFRHHLLELFSKAAYTEEKNIKISIVGAGATGVELAAEMNEAYQEITQSFGSEQRFRIQITLIEAAPRILGALTERVSEQATIALKRKKIIILTNTKVLTIHPKYLETSHGDIEHDTIIWTAGIKASENNKNYNLETNHINQFIVNEQLLTSQPHIYAMGDCSSAIWHDDIKLPARAQVAHQEANFLARLLINEYKGKEFKKNFVYKDAGSLVSLGVDTGVGNLRSWISGPGFFVKGLIAKYMYMSLHLLHHMQIIGFGNTVLLALARLAQNRVSGQLKLH